MVLHHIRKPPPGFRSESTIIAADAVSIASGVDILGSKRLHLRQDKVPFS